MAFMGLMLSGVLLIIVMAAFVLMDIAAIAFLILGLVRMNRNQDPKVCFVMSGLCAIPFIIGRVSDIIRLISHAFS